MMESYQQADLFAGLNDVTVAGRLIAVFPAERLKVKNLENLLLS